MKLQSGFGLTEILVSLFLSTIIITSLIQLYLNVKRSYLEFQKVLEVHLEIQWITDLLTDSIRRAGFTPCLGVDHLVSMDMRHFGTSLRGIKWVQSSVQSLQINRMSEIFSERISFISPTELTVASPVVFNKHRSLIVADCQHAEVHQILKVDKLAKGQKITLATPILYSYDEATFVGEWIEEQWMFKPNAKGVNTLHYRSIQTEELSALIHSLSVYGELIHGRQYIKINMNLDKNQPHEFSAMVRSS